MHLGVQLYRWFGRLRRKAFTLLVRGGFRAFGHSSALEAPAQLLGLSHVSVGRDVYIGANSWLTFLGDSRSPARGIVIGDGVSVAGGLVLSALEEIVIEDHVLVGRFVHISDHTHAHEETERPILAQGLTEPAPVLIKSGAWLGQGVVVCPGVTIGKNAVVAAGSVVRADVPDYCLAAGAPAVVKRQLNAVAMA